MKITTIADDATLDDLVERVHGAGAAKNEKVRDAFLKANPHLSDFGKLPAGTPVVVPDDSAAPPPPDTRLAGAVAQARHIIDTTREEIAGATTRGAASNAEKLAVLNDPKVVAAMKKNPEADNARKEALKEIKEQEKEWAATQEAMYGALAEFEETLQSFPMTIVPEDLSAAEEKPQAKGKKRAVVKPSTKEPKG